EVGRQVEFAANPAGLRGVIGTAAAIGVQGNTKIRRRLGLREIVNDVPDLDAGGCDQGVHAARDVEADDDVNWLSRLGFRFLSGCETGQRAGRESGEEEQLSQHGSTSASPLCEPSYKCKRRSTISLARERGQPSRFRAGLEAQPGAMTRSLRRGRYSYDDQT